MSKTLDSNSHEVTPRTNVSFNREEYKIIKETSETLGISIARVLKRKFFDGQLATPLLNITDAKEMMNILRRAADGLNIVGEHLNTGFRAGWNETFSKVSEDLSMIRSYVGGTFGRRKN
jgi:hypothetical protein